jgi:hypothetical protein
MMLSVWGPELVALSKKGQPIRCLRVLDSIFLAKIRSSRSRMEVDRRFMLVEVTLEILRVDKTLSFCLSGMR